MIQRCPECGAWCQTEGENLLERGLGGLWNQINDYGELGDSIGGKLGKRIGQIVGIASAPHRGLYEAIAGTKYQFTCECGYSWGTDDDKDDETSLYEHECYVEQLADRFLEIDTNNKKEWTQYLNELEKAWHSEDNTTITQSIICDTIAAYWLFSFINLEDNEKYLNLSLEKIDKSLSLFDLPDCHVTKGLILSYHNKYTPYCALRELIHHKDIEHHDYFSMETIMEHYNDICEDYEKGFLKIPKEQRKYLVLVSDYITIPESFKVLKMSDMPNGLKILGQISENTLYIIHPLKEDTYIPCNEYTIELFREQLYEYRYIMQCLGAKKFSIKDLHINNSEIGKDERFKVGIGGEYEGYSAKGSYENDQKNEQYSKLHNELELEIRYAPTAPPYIPKNLIWYNHKTEWKQYCESRLAGGLMELRQKVSNKSNIGLTNQNSKKIEGEFNAMIGKINGGYESDYNFSLKEDKEHIWEIYVEFFPITEYHKANTTSTSPDTTFTQNEQEYIEELKAFLEDGEITEKERRHLERFRNKYGITIERAKELENLFLVVQPSRSKWWKFWR